MSGLATPLAAASRARPPHLPLPGFVHLPTLKAKKPLNGCDPERASGSLARSFAEEPAPRVSDPLLPKSAGVSGPVSILFAMRKNLKWFARSKGGSTVGG